MQHLHTHTHTQNILSTRKYVIVYMGECLLSVVCAHEIRSSEMNMSIISILLSQMKKNSPIDLTFNLGEFLCNGKSFEMPRFERAL